MIELRALMREQLALDERLQTVLDGLLKPTTTGYMHGEEQWSIAWIRRDEYGGGLEIALDPPEGSCEWTEPTIELLQTLQRNLECDDVHAVALEAGEVRYIACFDRKETK